MTSVTVEHAQRNGSHWVVVIDQDEGRLLWGRYPSQAEAELQAVEARAYLFDNPDGGDLPPYDDGPASAPMP